MTVPAVEGAQSGPATSTPPLDAEESLNALLDAAESMVRAMLATDAAPALIARLQRLMPAPEPAPTPERLLLADTLSVLNFASPRIHASRRSQLDGVRARLRVALGVPTDASSDHAEPEGGAA